MSIFSVFKVPHPPAYTEKAGIQYAQALVEKTQFLSLILTLTGWIFVVSGAALAIAGSVLGSDITFFEDPETKRDAMGVIIAHRGLLCSTNAIIFAGIGWQVLDRASASARVASISTQAILKASSFADGDEDAMRIADQSAYDACVKAKTAWLEGRMNNDRLTNIVEALTQHQNKNPPPGKNPPLDSHG